MKVKTSLDQFTSDDHETILLYCSRCGHRWEGSAMFSGFCPDCGGHKSEPGTTDDLDLGPSCGNCKHHRHYPKCCEIHGKDHPHAQVPPSPGISAVNCPDYEVKA